MDFLPKNVNACMQDLAENARFLSEITDKPKL